MIDRAMMVSSDFEEYDPPGFDLGSTYTVLGTEYVGDKIIYVNIREDNGDYYYYDMTTDEVFTIDTEGHDIDFSLFHNGIISAVLKGADELEYVTMYDKTGKRLFEPFQTPYIMGQAPYSIGLGDYILAGEYLKDTNMMDTLIDKNEKSIPIRTMEGASASVHCVTNANSITGIGEYEFMAKDSDGLMSPRFDARYYFSEELLPVQYEGNGAYLGTDGILKITSLKAPQHE
jgi:hypothetical protein